MVLGVLWSVFLALLVRLLYAAHSFLAIWRLVDAEDNDLYWLLGGLLILLFIETGYIIFKRKGKEWKWVSPSVIFFLIAACPTIWFLELDRVDRYSNVMERGNSSACNNEQLVMLSDFYGVRIPIKLTSDDWLASLEQMLVFILIIGRWLSPKTRFTHDELSILLFVYLGIGSDIMELLTLFEEDYVIGDTNVVYLTLIVWNVSLLQFALRVSPTRGSKRRVRVGNGGNGDGNGNGNEEDEFMYSYNQTLGCWPAEAWGVLATMVLQDGPFLALRLYVIFKNQTLSYTILFYSLKNLLLLIVQFYRLCVLLCCRYDHLTRRLTRVERPPRQKKQKKRRAQEQAENGTANGVEDYRTDPGPQRGGHERGQRRNRHQQYNTPMAMVHDPYQQQQGGHHINYGYQ